MEIHGVFSAYNLSDDEKDLFAEYLQYVMNNPLIEFVKYLLGDDYLKFIDIFQHIQNSNSLRIMMLLIIGFVDIGGINEMK